jgi:hypothetical protein
MLLAYYVVWAGMGQDGMGRDGTGRDMGLITWMNVWGHGTNCSSRGIKPRIHITHCRDCVTAKPNRNCSDNTETRHHILRLLGSICYIEKLTRIDNLAARYHLTDLRVNEILHGSDREFKPMVSSCEGGNAPSDPWKVRRLLRGYLSKDHTHFLHTYVCVTGVEAL